MVWKRKRKWFRYREWMKEFNKITEIKEKYYLGLEKKIKEKITWNLSFWRKNLFVLVDLLFIKLLLNLSKSINLQKFSKFIKF